MKHHTHRQPREERQTNEIKISAHILFFEGVGSNPSEGGIGDGLMHIQELQQRT